MEDKFKFTEKIEDMSDGEVNAQQAFVKNYQMPVLRPLDFVYEGEPEEVVYKTAELFGICPMTGLPDLYDLKLTYIPKAHIPELKSFKFYLLEFRNIPIFHENLAARILKDFVESVKPESAKIHLDVAVRGGIGTEVTKVWRSDD